MFSLRLHCLIIKSLLTLVDVNCQNWPITGYTRSWYTGMMYWKQCLQAPPTCLSPAPPWFFAQLFSMHFPHYIGAWKRLHVYLIPDAMMSALERVDCSFRLYCPKLKTMTLESWSRFTVKWSFVSCLQFRLVGKAALKLLLVFVVYTESNSKVLYDAVQVVDSNRGMLNTYFSWLLFCIISCLKNLFQIIKCHLIKDIILAW